jgi:hypothetical protein
VRAKALHGLSSLFAATLGCAGIYLGLGVWRGEIPKAPLATILGIAGLGASLALHYRSDLEADDYIDGLKFIVGHATDAAGEVFGGNAELAGKAATTIIRLPIVPEKIQTMYQQMHEKAISAGWIDSAEYNKVSEAIVGPSGSGKTRYLKHRILKFLEPNPAERVQRLWIIDINYGKPDGDKPNDWFGLPTGSTIATDVHEGYATLKKFHGEMKQRKKLYADAAREQRKVTLAPETKLVIDEAIGFMQEMLDIPAYADGIKMIGDLMYQGRGYGCKVTFGFQSLAVGETKFNLSKLSQVTLLMLGKAPEDKINKLNVSIPDELTEKLKEFRKMKGCEYACLARLPESGWDIKVVPNIPEYDIRFQFPTQSVDPTDEWWSDTCKGDLRAWFDKQADIAAVNPEGVTKKELAERFGVEQRSTNIRYSRLISEFEKLTQQHKGV